MTGVQREARGSYPGMQRQTWFPVFGFLLEVMKTERENFITSRLSGLKTGGLGIPPMKIMGFFSLFDLVTHR